MAVPLAVLGMVTVSAPAAQAAVVAAGRTAQGGFPVWYQDNAGNRVEPCLEANDPGCVLPTTEPNYDPAQPLAFPTNFPSEFFYALATSSNVATPGCGASPAGRAFVTLALEGAFIGGAPKAGDQMVFGRVRVRATSGLCAGQSYTFRHPFGQVTLTANAAGAIPVNTPGATVDVGCLAPTALTPCDFSLANASPVMGSVANGFLRWDPAFGAAPAGYLGDGVTPHQVIGANGANSLNGLDITGPDGAGGVWNGNTNLFTVAGRLSELSAAPNPVDFAGVQTGTTSATKTVTVTNLGTIPLALPNNAVSINNNAFRLSGANTCSRVTLDPNGTCSFGVAFTAPRALGPVSALATVAYTGGGRSPLQIPLLGTSTTNGAQPLATATPSPLAFGDVRVRTNLTKSFTVTNTGNSPLTVSAVALDLTSGDNEQFRVTGGTCTAASVPALGTCTVTVMFAPTVSGAKAATVLVHSNTVATPLRVPVTGNATGGVAAVSTDKLPLDEFPTWYRDENGVKLSQCIDPTDPYCIVLADATFNPSKAPQFLPNDPSKALNFPGEFFYTVADSDLLSTPGCNGTAPGKSAYRSAIEGTFVNGEPVDGEQMVFGRERFYVTSGLCPGAVYTITTPYGQTQVPANAKGGIARNAATVDVGCAPVPPALCNFADALSSPVFGGVLRWDPATAPAAPAGYLGDAVSLHRVVGAPFKEDTVNPSNYFKITGPGLPPAGLSTNLFSVMGKLRGPLEVTSPLEPNGAVQLPTSDVGSPATTTITLTNTGVAVPGGSNGNITVNSLTVGGADAADYAVTGQDCTTQASLLPASDGPPAVPAGTCTITVTFTPSATGVRNGTLTVTHTGLNNPLVVPLQGTGSTPTGAAISFVPRSLAFGQLAVGRASAAERVTISNAGGTAPLVVSQLVANGPAGAYTLSNDTCTNLPVDIGGSCSVDVTFSPTAAVAQNGTLVTTDNAAGGTHSIPLTGSGFDGAKSVSLRTDQFGYPTYYQDANGTRLQPCVDTANCVLLGVPDANAPLTIPDNFPPEFFYALADSEQLTIPGCNPGDPSGTAFLRVGLEGSFAGGAPLAGDQTTFTRIRIVAKGGFCPNVPDYTAVTPYGTFTFATDATGSVKPNAGTQDTGCGAAPCNFADALQSPGAVLANVATPIESFLRWDPNVAPAAPKGYLGDAVGFHRVVGGTYVKPGASGAFNGLEIYEGQAGPLLASTDKWLVSGKLASLAPDTYALDFGNVDQGTQSAAQTVTVRNEGAQTTGVTPSLAGANASDFTVSGGDCATANTVVQDASCTVDVKFTPATAGTKTATLVLKQAAGGPSTTITLTGVANVVALPAIAVNPGVLSYGTITAPGSSPATFTVTNTGGSNLVVSSAVIGGAAASDFTLTGSTCPAAAAPDKWSIAPGAANACTVTVTFKPSAIGARTGSLTLTHNAAGGTTVVSLTGTGAGASWSVSPNPVGFGTVNRGTSKTSTLSVKNTGTANATITGATVVGGTYFGVVVNPATSTCFNGTVVAPGKTCSISVTFSPAANAAVTTYTGTLNIDGGGASLPRITSVTMTATTK